MDSTEVVIAYGGKSVIVGKTRVRDAAGYTGTVEYVGPVASAKDPTVFYAGIVWDDWSRGIHDGSVLCRVTKQMIRHFQAPHPTSGSFIRLSSLDTGTTWTPSMTVKERYVSIDSERLAPSNVFPDHTACTSSGRDDKKIEFIGELKIRSQQQVNDLTEISMRRSGIAAIDTTLDWAAMKHVRELDLAGNLLSDWRSVVDVLISLPNLRKLSVAGNRIGDLEITNNFSCRNLIHLNINNTGIRRIETLVRLGKSIPNLEELILANNSNGCCAGKAISEDVVDSNDLVVSTDSLSRELAYAFPKLIYLDCSACCCFPCQKNPRGSDVPACKSSLQETRCCLFYEAKIMMILRFLPKLQTLSLDGNRIRHLRQLANGNCFPELRHLQISDNCIRTWSELDALNSLPLLISLRVRNNPFLFQRSGQAYSEAVLRSMIIGHLPKVQHLNGSVVTERERKEAALWCVRDTIRKRQHLPGLSEPASDPAIEEDTVHPRYSYWIALYPHLVNRPTNVHNDKDSILADSVLNLTIRSMAADSCTIKPLIRRLPSQLTVSRLKALCARYFGLDPDLQEFKFVVGADTVPCIMDQGDDATLHYYGIPCDGAEILLFERNQQ